MSSDERFAILEKAVQEVQDTVSQKEDQSSTFFVAATRASLIISGYSCSSDEKITSLEKTVEELRSQLADSQGIVKQKDRSIMSLGSQNTDSSPFIVPRLRPL